MTCSLCLICLCMVAAVPLAMAEDAGRTRQDLTLPRKSSPQSGVAYAENKLAAVIIPTIQFSQATISEAVGYLRVVAGREDKDGAVNMSLALGDLQKEPEVDLYLRAVPLGKALDYVCLLTGFEYELDNTIVRIRPASAPTLPDPKRWVHGSARARMEQITLPQVHFAGASVAEAMEFVRVHLRHVEGAPKGISNFVLLPGEDGSLDLELKNVTVWEAVSQIAFKTGYAVLADDHAVLLVPIENR